MTSRPTSTHKKVVVELEKGASLHGYLNPGVLDLPNEIELLDENGARQILPWKQVRIIWFVRDWNLSLPPYPRVFTRRPRLEGLWVRIRFHNDDTLEGVLPNDLLHLSSNGYLLTAPQFIADHQKVFVPAAAVTEIHVLGVISPARSGRRSLPATEQPGLFSE